MRLESCHIEGFGKWVDRQLRFGSGLQRVLAKNGWGKSTLAVFLKVMFYGFANENSRQRSAREREQYRPWQSGSPYGGSVVFHYQGEDYELRRSFGQKAAEDMLSVTELRTRLDQTGRFGAAPGETIFGIDAESFYNTVYIAEGECGNSATDGINARIGSPATGAEDLQRLTKVLKELKDRTNALTPGRSSGALAKLEMEITGVRTELMGREALEERYRSQLEEREELRGAIRVQTGLLAEARRAYAEAGKEAERRAVLRSHRELLRRVETIEEQLDAERAHFGERIPTSGELAAAEERLRELERLATRQEDLSLSQKEQEELTAYEALCREQEPELAALEEAEELAEQLRTLREEERELEPGAEQRARYEELAGRLGGERAVSELYHMEELRERLAERRSACAGKSLELEQLSAREERRAEREADLLRSWEQEQRRAERQYEAALERQERHTERRQARYRRDARILLVAAILGIVLALGQFLAWTQVAARQRAAADAVSVGAVNASSAGAVGDAAALDAASVGDAAALDAVSVGVMDDASADVISAGALGGGKASLVLLLGSGCCALVGAVCWIARVLGASAERRVQAEDAAEQSRLEEESRIAAPEGIVDGVYLPEERQRYHEELRRGKRELAGLTQSAESAESELRELLETYTGSYREETAAAEIARLNRDYEEYARLRKTIRRYEQSGYAERIVALRDELSRRLPGLESEPGEEREAILRLRHGMEYGQKLRERRSAAEQAIERQAALREENNALLEPYRALHPELSGDAELINALQEHLATWRERESALEREREALAAYEAEHPLSVLSEGGESTPETGQTEHPLSVLPEGGESTSEAGQEKTSAYETGRGVPVSEESLGTEVGEACTPETGQTEPDMEALHRELEELEDGLEQLKARLSQLAEQVDTSEGALDQLDEAQERLEELMKRKEVYTRQHELYRETSAYLEAAREDYLSSFVVPLEKAFSRHYAAISDTAEDYRIDVNIELSCEAEGAYRPIQRMSSGYRDLAYLCLRLALVDVMYGEEKPFLLLDDPFVHMDREKRLGALTYLERLGAEYQMIYLSCHGVEAAEG